MIKENFFIEKNKPDTKEQIDKGFDVINKEITKDWRHYCDSYEMFIIEGEGTVEFEGKSIDVKNYTLFFFTEGEYFVLIPKKNNKLKVTMLYFTAFFMFPFEDRTITFLEIPLSCKNVYCYLDEEQYNEIIVVLKKILEHREPLTHINRIYIITGISWILMNYMIAEEKVVRSLNDKLPVERILYVIQNEFFRPSFSVNYLAKEVGYSPNYTSVIFKKEFGISVQQYVLNRRLEFAYEMLLRQKYTVGDIARNVGFSNTSYFTRAFKKKYNMTPTELKEARIEKFKKDIETNKEV